MGAQACRRARPPSLGDPRRRVALVSTLAVVLICFFLFPFFLSLVFSPSSLFLFLLFSYFLLPHYLAPRALLARYMRAGACGIYTVSTLFNNKIAVINLPISCSNSYKIIFILPFFLVGLVFRFVFVFYILIDLNE